MTDASTYTRDEAAAMFVSAPPVEKPGCIVAAGSVAEFFLP